MWEEDGKELPMLISAQVVTVPVDGVKTLTPVLDFVVWSVMVILALLQTSPLMVQVIREYVVEQEERMVSCF